MACLKANKYGWTRFYKSLVFVFVSIATVGGGGGGGLPALSVYHHSSNP